MQACGNYNYRDCLLKKFSESLKSHDGSGRRRSTTKKSASVCTVYDSADECTFKRTQAVASLRESSYDYSSRGACNGTQRLAKNTFLALMGTSPYSPPPLVDVTLDELNQKTVQTALDEAGGNQQIAARNLGITLSSLRRKIRQWSVEPQSPSVYVNPSRKFFENLPSPWKITSFEPRTREVCVDIIAAPQTNHVSATIPRQT